MDFGFGFSVADRDDGRAQKTGGVEPLLAVVITVIFYCNRRPVEYMLCIGKVKPVFFQVGFPLGFAPCKFHELYYTYDYTYLKSELVCGCA